MKTFIATALLASLIGTTASYAASTTKTTNYSSQATATTQTSAQMHADNDAQQSSSSTWQFKAPTQKPHHRNEFNG